MKSYILLALSLALALSLTAGALAEPTALDAFHALLAEEESIQPATGDGCLDAVMAGDYAIIPEDDEAAAKLAQALDALAAVTSRDIAAYASEHGLPVAQVRNAWYRAMANALEAELRLDPEAARRHGDALAILALFLEPEAGDAEERQAIRSEMTRDQGRRIAQQTGLPESFVDFVIMSDDWDDDDWRNDEDWQAALGWGELSEDGFDDIALGSRDAPGDTRIADLQELLIGLGYLKGKADGVFGPRTQAALVEFQLANGLPARGVYDENSLCRLQSADAVARWDYGEKFWDSRDFDTPDTPDRADTPDVPDTPDTYDTPDAPAATAKPKKDGGAKESGKKADTPDTPD